MNHTVAGMNHILTGMSHICTFKNLEFTSVYERKKTLKEI